MHRLRTTAQILRPWHPRPRRLCGGKGVGVKTTYRIGKPHRQTDGGMRHGASAQSQRWGYVIANAKFLLNDEEHLAELLRERRRMFKEKVRTGQAAAWVGL